MDTRETQQFMIDLELRVKALIQRRSVPFPENDRKKKYGLKAAAVLFCVTDDDQTSAFGACEELKWDLEDDDETYEMWYLFKITDPGDSQKAPTVLLVLLYYIPAPARECCDYCEGTGYTTYSLLEDQTKTIPCVLCNYYAAIHSQSS